MIASWIIDALVQQGVTHFCTAPGSRSTPLVSAAILHPQVATHVHYDERGLGFLALGIAKGCQKPVAVIVTSGTAVGNLLPAVMEAHHSNTPLILLTADRPHELRDCGANQTCDQIKLFQAFVRWQTDCPTEGDETFFRSLMAQAYFASMKNPPGPVHINCPFREPLYKPHVGAFHGRPLEMVFPRHAARSYHTQHARGAILVGRLPMREDIHPILELAKRLQWPVLADILSNARCTPTEEQMRYFDYQDKPTPDFVLHFGERMTSKKVLQWLKEIRPEMVHVSPRPELQDAERILTGRVQSDIREFCAGFTSGFEATWFSSWRDQEPQFEETGAFTEAHAMRMMSKRLPPGFGIFLGNGMPIRDADHFLFPSQPRAFFANRGLSGIDGNIATLAGLAEEMPMLGMIGDQAALYDLNSLPLLQKAKHPAILLISNNFGGGIFHHLPIAASPHFETFWANAHDMRFEQAANMFNLPYIPFEAMQFDRAGIVELITDRRENTQYQQRGVVK